MQHTAAMSRHKPTRAYIPQAGMLALREFEQRYNYVRGKAGGGGYVTMPNYGPIIANKRYASLSVVKHGATKIDQITRKDDGFPLYLEDDVAAGTDTPQFLDQWKKAIQAKGKMPKGRMVFAHATHAVKLAYQYGIIPSFNCATESVIYAQALDRTPEEFGFKTVFGPVAACAQLDDVIGSGRYCTICPVPLTVRGTQALVSFAPLAFKLFCAARQNAVLRRSPFHIWAIHCLSCKHLEKSNIFWHCYREFENDHLQCHPVMQSLAWSVPESELRELPPAAIAALGIEFEEA